jgi:ectoine hydroxylase-related dioxygenase (phytanoyl-CoA dioxygenase family)
MSLATHGWLNVASGLGEDLLENLRSGIFQPGRVGTRCLLDHPLVRETAIKVRDHLSRLGLLENESVAIQAIAFDKTPETNWKVAWHQDLMFPLARKVSAPGYTLACVKDGTPFARPPVAVLADLTAVRLSLDACGLENGPLRISPATHQHGIIPAGQVMDHVARAGDITCTNQTGDLLLIKPLLLHASSQAASPAHRRVLHLVYHSGCHVTEAWHHAV